MKVIDVIPKDIVILNEFSVSEITSLLFCLEHCTIEYDTANDEEKKHADYFTNKFYKVLLAIEERIKNVD